jgi:hypothetical protein
MRRWLLVLLLVSSPAWAEWVSVFEMDRAVPYFDPATIEKDAHLRRVWELQDLKRRMEGDHSAKVFVEYDCKARRYRWLRADWFSGRTGSGEMAEERRVPSDRTEPAPRTGCEDVLKFVAATGEWPPPTSPRASRLMPRDQRRQPARARLIIRRDRRTGHLACSRCR